MQFACADLDGVAAWLAAQPAHAPLRLTVEAEKRQHDTYFDTDDWALWRARFTLRVRRKADGAEATLKSFGSVNTTEAGSTRTRIEINQPLSSPDARVDSEQGPVSERIRLLAGGRPLRELFVIETGRRLTRVSLEADELAEVALDNTKAIVAGMVRSGFCRVEVEETLPGGLDQVLPLVEAMRAACALSPAATSKFQEGILAAGLQPEQCLEFGNLSLSPDAFPAAYAMAVIRRHFITFLQHEPGARLGEDPEELHDMRVATRRMRASMSTFRDVLPEGMEALREELKWIAGCLGEVRDLDVQIDWLEDLRRRSSWDEATALGPLIENRATLRQEARQALLEAMAGERYAALVSSMGAALREPVLPPEEPAAAVFAPHDVLEPLPEFGYRVLRKRYRRLRRAAEALTPDSEQTDYHATRILAKRLRYAAEALTPAFGEPARELVQDLKALQDVLGEMQDAAVGIEWIRAAALGAEGWPSASLLRAGELIEQQRRRIDALREQSPEASDAVKKRWRRLQRAVRKAEKQDAEPLPAAPADAPEDRLTSQMPEHVAYRRSLLQWLLRRQQPPSG